MELENNEKPMIETELLSEEPTPPKDPSLLEINVSDSVSVAALGPGQF